jgi:hypothetical protein
MHVRAARGKLRAVVVCALCAGLGVSASAARADQPASRQDTTNPVFAHALKALKRAGVPLLLPTYLPQRRVYVWVETAVPGHYALTVDYTPDCRGADACTIGDLDGVRHATGKLDGRRIRLAHGITGYFVPFSCGASCGDSTLSFDWKGYRYTFGLHAGAKPPLLKMANSALQAGPAKPGA